MARHGMYHCAIHSESALAYGASSYINSRYRGCRPSMVPLLANVPEDFSNFKVEHSATTRLSVLEGIHVLPSMACNLEFLCCIYFASLRRHDFSTQP